MISRARWGPRLGDDVGTAGVWGDAGLGGRRWETPREGADAGRGGRRRGPGCLDHRRCPSRAFLAI